MRFDARIHLPGVSKARAVRKPDLPALGTGLGFDWTVREIRDVREGAPCANRELAACNGLAGAGGYCASCELTRVRPADDDLDGLERFAKAEAANAG